jgi:glycosyltransferase involved in cell wall biosynthesis
MISVSVILPTRQRNRLLARALASLRAQTFRDFEVVLVDDNPPEARVARDPSLRELLDDPRVTIVESPQPRNAAAARNRGLERARGEWIAYLDDDDAYRPEKLARQVRRAEETGVPVGLCGMGYHLGPRLRRRQVAAEWFEGDAMLIEAQPGTVALFHRRAPQVRFDETLDAGEDAHFYQSLIRHFGLRRVFNVPACLVDVHPQPGARVNTDAEAAWLACRRILEEFGPDYGARARKIFELRARLHLLRTRPGALGVMTRVAAALLRHDGWRAARQVANAYLFRIPGARRLMVT